MFFSIYPKNAKKDDELMKNVKKQSLLILRNFFVLNGLLYRRTRNMGTVELSSHAVSSFSSRWFLFPSCLCEHLLRF
jgi:hypothetical protein